MIESKIVTRYQQIKKKRLAQGDLLKDIQFKILDDEVASTSTAILLEYCVVLSQDCDIEQDYKFFGEKEHDKRVPNLLVCPAYIFEAFAQGRHVHGWQMETFNKKKLEKLQKNDEYKRYHYLKSDVLVGVPDLVLDFKHFYALPRTLLYQRKETHYIATISELFREDLSLRFASYLSRIGLPEL